MKLDKSGKTLKVTSYIASTIFILVILCPLLLIASYSIKDATAIYEYPPNLIPSAAKSVSIVLDYSKYAGEDEAALLDKILKDSTAAMYITYMELNKSSIREIKVFGTMNGKNIFYQRAHSMLLTCQMDYGIYKAVTRLNRMTLAYDDKYKKSAEDMGYTYDISGIKESYDAKKLGGNDLNKAILGYLNNESIDRVMNGEILGTTVSINNLLLLESYKYYFMAPAFMFPNFPFIVKYSFFAFIFNTLLVMAWAVISQIGLCSLSAYAISRLFSRRMANILMLYFLVTMMIPFMCIVVPQLILMKSIGALNNYGAMLLPYLYPAAFYIFLFKGFFDRLPQSLFDAANIDGASQWYIFTRICMSLSKPIIAVLTLNVVVSAWGDFFWYLIAANRTNLWTVNLALYSISGNNASEENVTLGLAFLTILPVIIVTLIFSKQIKESIANAGIKG